MDSERIMVIIMGVWLALVWVMVLIVKVLQHGRKGVGYIRAEKELMGDYGLIGGLLLISLACLVGMIVLSSVN